MIELYQRVSLNQNFPEYKLKKGDIATFIDTVPHPTGGEEGSVLEVFNALGESIDVVIVRQSAVNSLQESRSQRQKENQDELGTLLEKYKINTGIPDLAYQHHH